MLPDIPGPGPPQHEERDDGQRRGAEHWRPGSGGEKLRKPEAGPAALAIALLLEVAGKKAQYSGPGSGQIGHV